MPQNASGVLYALGGAGGGVTRCMDQGHLVYLYNMTIIEQYTARSAQPIPAGTHTIKVITSIAGPAKNGAVRRLVDGEEARIAELKRTVPVAFSAGETFDVGVDLGSPVSIDYADRRPFQFDGEIEIVDVRLRYSPQ